MLNGADTWPTATDADTRAVSHPAYLRFYLVVQLRLSTGQYSWNVVAMECGSQWRSARRLLHKFLNVRAVTRFDDYQRKHAYRFLSHLVESPDHFFHHTES